MGADLHATSEKDEIEKGDVIAWAAYHASQQTPTHGLPAVCAMLPLFYTCND